MTDDSNMNTQDDAGGAASEEQSTRANGRRRVTPTGRITLTLDKDVLKKLHHAAIEEGKEPCRIVEDLLRPYVRPYVLSRRDRRTLSETESAA